MPGLFDKNLFRQQMQRLLYDQSWKQDLINSANRYQQNQQRAAQLIAQQQQDARAVEDQEMQRLKFAQELEDRARAEEERKQREVIPNKDFLSGIAADPFDPATKAGQLKNFDYALQQKEDEQRRAAILARQEAQARAAALRKQEVELARQRLAAAKQEEARQKAANRIQSVLELSKAQGNYEELLKKFGEKRISYNFPTPSMDTLTAPGSLGVPQVAESYSFDKPNAQPEVYAPVMEQFLKSLVTPEKEEQKQTRKLIDQYQLGRAVMGNRAMAKKQTDTTVYKDNNGQWWKSTVEIDPVTGTPMDPLDEKITPKEAENFQKLHITKSFKY